MADPIELPPLEVTPSTVRQAVASVLHTILFCRLLGAVKPVDRRADAWGLTYVRVPCLFVLLPLPFPSPSLPALAGRPASGWWIELTCALIVARTLDSAGGRKS
jgi:hypothetical protein